MVRDKGLFDKARHSTSFSRMGMVAAGEWTEPWPLEGM
jgi:hypothetical protein